MKDESERKEKAEGEILWLTLPPSSFLPSPSALILSREVPIMSQAAPQAEAGQVFPVLPEASGPLDFQFSTLVKTPSLEVRRLVLPMDRELPTHHANGEITVHCLSGRVRFTAHDEPRELRAGQMLWLEPKAPHALLALEDSVLLVTRLTP